MVGEWMVPVNRDSGTSQANSANLQQSEQQQEQQSEQQPIENQPDPTMEEPAELEEKKEEVEDKADLNEPKGDPEMAPVYLRRLLPIFTNVYQSTMLLSVRKASLALIRKMVHYIVSCLLEEISAPDYASVNFGSQLVEVLAVVLDNEVIILIHNTLLSQYMILVWSWCQSCLFSPDNVLIV